MKHFDGSDPKLCNKWIKNVEKYVMLTGQPPKAVECETADGPVSDAIKMAIKEGTKWIEMKYYSEVLTWNKLLLWHFFTGKN